MQMYALFFFNFDFFFRTKFFGYIPWFLPQRQSNKTITELDNLMSPLIECIITKRQEQSSQILTRGVCITTIDSFNECVSAAKATGAVITSSSKVSDSTKPYGCLISPNKSNSRVMVNIKAKKSSNMCGSQSKSLSLEGNGSFLNDAVSISIQHDGVTARITMTGPDKVWFGVGFGATAMKDLPYSIIIDGIGNITERKLGNHECFIFFSISNFSSITVVSNTVTGGTRTVVMTRLVTGKIPDYYNIPKVPGKINVITAIGATSTFSYHAHRTGASLVLLPMSVPACICKPTSTSYLTYMENTALQSTSEFYYDCVDEPRSDMLRHGDGTGRNVPNAACNMETYHVCFIFFQFFFCNFHSWYLTDKEQESRIPKNMQDKYFLKWRYYFQEYTPATTDGSIVTMPSHLHLKHFVFLIDASVNDYEEDNAHYGHKSIGKITAHLKAKDLGLDGSVDNTYTKILPFVMTPHYTNKILCNVTALYGDVCFIVFQIRFFFSYEILYLTFFFSNIFP
eukprot:GSMAST32.ASY1.ANO1.2794.1 assembled CDS